MTQKQVQIALALLAWFAVLTQYALMLENRVLPIGETTIRFFSFFTILTNSLVAVYFTRQALLSSTKFLTFLNKPGALSAITVYILVVGLVYQVALRHIWEPEGLQMVVDELLHSVIPLFVALYWWRYERKEELAWQQPVYWAIYPLLYLVFILVRGSFSGFYPYPFMEVPAIGMAQVLLNACVILVLFLFFSFTLIGLGRFLIRKKAVNRETV